jgi:pSer/pThr/pTyr-binding forkhead associated (FHA) protein
MPRLTIVFKDIPLESIDLESGKTSIGRDPSNTVRIDSLAIADFHAEIRSTPKGYIIRQLNAGFPIYINNKQPVAEEVLHDGDHILIGKHSMYFSEEGAHTEVGENEESNPAAHFRPFEGSFQVMNGKQIGMVIPLKNNVTHIGKESSGMVIVTRGNEGYTISPGSSDVLLTINGHAVDQGEAPLADGDIIRINSSLLQFFQK